MGIVIAVSHDRYFLDNIADRILELDGKGHVTQYEGGYTDYLEAKKRSNREAENGSAVQKMRVSSVAGAEKRAEGKEGKDQSQKAGKDWKQNQPQKLKMSYKEEREYAAIDEDIAALEDDLERIERQIEANATNSVKLKELLEEQEKAQAALDEKMERWVYLSDLAERINAQE